jgi:hypothetical protein
MEAFTLDAVQYGNRAVNTVEIDSSSITTVQSGKIDARHRNAPTSDVAFEFHEY